MEGLPWPTITAASGGWFLTVAFVWALITGRLVTKREAEVYITAYKKADDDRRDLIATVAGMTAVGKIQQKFSEVAMEQRAEGSS